MEVGVIQTNDNITVIVGDQTRVFSRGDKDFDLYTVLYGRGDFARIEKEFSADKTLVENAFEGQVFKVKDGIVYVNNKPVVTSVGNRIKEFATKGQDASRLVKFWERLLTNPSYWCVQSLFDFLDRHNCPIAEDGRFMAYKAVTGDFKDKHTKRVDNSPGVKVTPFNRNEVDDDKQKACSFGYHVGSVAYVHQFADGGDKFIEVLVDPADVVSVPQDTTKNKMRVCTYEVVKEIKREEMDYNKFEGSYDTDDCDDDEECNECGELLHNCDCDDEEDDFDDDDDLDDYDY